MSSAVKFYGLVIFFVILIFVSVDYNKKIMIDENTNLSTRTTQMSTIHEAINLGDLIVNQKLTMDEEKAMELWVENFKKNNDLNLNYKIEIIGIKEDPPAIAVRIRGFTEYTMLETDCTVDYFNLIVVDDAIKMEE